MSNLVYEATRSTLLHHNRTPHPHLTWRGRLSYSNHLPYRTSHSSLLTSHQQRRIQTPSRWVTSTPPRSRYIEHDHMPHIPSTPARLRIRRPQRLPSRSLHSPSRNLPSTTTSTDPIYTSHPRRNSHRLASLSTHLQQPHCLLFLYPVHARRPQTIQDMHTRNYGPHHICTHHSPLRQH